MVCGGQEEAGCAELCALNMGRGPVQAVLCPPPPSWIWEGAGASSGLCFTCCMVFLQWYYANEVFSGIMQMRSLSSKAFLGDWQSGPPLLWLGHQERVWTLAKICFLKPFPSKGRPAKCLFTGYAQGFSWTTEPAKFVLSSPLPSGLSSDAFSVFRCLISPASITPPSCALATTL